ncbi:hydantoinase/oxoprolinase N-terminal domain-containing protein [Streptomyces shenzhenensis]|uniref:hydantoinase/oxoprolinase N-terminal domain-containing protein n=1 Tax=Streptomyces shenzhenensis TaxID=943815 RepID=UPI0037FEE1C4
MRIGIDVGGTNTDAVLLDGDRLVGSVKQPTSKDVAGGVVCALRSILAQAGVGPGLVDAVMIGTTQFTNAVVSRRQLVPTGIVRLCLPSSTGVPPMVDWPEDLSRALGNHVYMAHGGTEYDGRPISPVRPDELRAVGERLAADGVEAVAISSVFSPVSHEMELQAEEILREQLPGARFSLSYRIGRIGLIERENATIVNASLLAVAEQVTAALTDALAMTGITAPVYLSQNDGTLMDVMYARTYPVATFASGPTNSMRGAAVLSGLRDCVVVDIGGTTSDIGMLINSFPRQAGSEVDIGGVRTNFRMPDVIALGIGGGSVVDPDDPTAIGPASVGFELTSRARVFGGDTLTATDVAVAARAADVGDRSLVKNLSPAFVRAAMDHMAVRIGQVADLMRTSPQPTPAVLVGGGAILVGSELPGFDTVVRPPNAGVANALGAAIAQIGGEVDRIYNVGGRSREDVLESARNEAVERAVAAGARPGSVEVVMLDEIPISYLPGDSVRVRAKAVGDLDVSGLAPADERRAGEKR